MTRRYAPTIIDVTHGATEAAEFQRPRARPVPVRAAPEAPAAWEAVPEPEPAPIPKVPKRPKIVVETRPRQ